MAKNIEIEEEIYTHEYIWRSSTYLVACCEEENADYRQLIPALLMTFLAFEAFVNFLGHVLAPDLWKDEKKNFKGKGLEGKLGAIEQRLPSFNWEKGKPPYQSVKTLEAYRNMVSHGKVVASKYNAEPKEDGTHFRFQHSWDEYLSVASVKKARDEIKAFSCMLLESARKVSQEPHLVFDAYEGSLAQGSGSSAGV
ncbi:MAG: hypothetical protein O2999_07310 [Nitrospirae bacterium]|nr:hypothetical protein [Nitrospirota bacterium]MDA1304092.1 hypothetical protein [Nitrospirota bacterium]